MSAQGSDTVNADSLDIQQLSQVKKQLGEELEHLSASFTQLHGAQSKFKECLRCVEARSDSSGEKMSILVPLTNSLYVRGEMPASDHVLVDIGTGYLVQKSTKEARVFYESKVNDLDRNLREIEGALQQRTGNMQALEEVLRQKVLSDVPQDS